MHNVDEHNEYFFNDNEFFSGVHRCYLRDCLRATEQYELLPAEGP
jgi:hypothetical protein